MSRFRTRLARIEKAIPAPREPRRLTVRDPDDPMPEPRRRKHKGPWRNIVVIDPPGWGEGEYEDPPELFDDV